MTTANKFYKILEPYGVDFMISQGKAWYPNAWKYCVGAGKWHGVTPERVAAMIAVTSPRARWSKNLEAVEFLLQDAKRPEYKRRSYYGVLGASARKGMLVANDRYYSRHVTGPKVTNFYLNILGHTEPVTVDSIMSKAAGYGSDVNNKIRAEVTEACVALGTVLDLSPRDAQAAVWCAYRRSAA